MSGNTPSAPGAAVTDNSTANSSSSTNDASNARTVRVKLGPSIALEDTPFRDRSPAPKLLANLMPSILGYELIEELGSGGNGVVYKAKHISLGRVVAVKTHFSGGFVDPEHLTRLRNEAQALAKLQHPNIVQIYEVGEDSGRPYLALEYCRGGTLSRKLDGKPWEPIRAATLVATLADAVQAAHTAGVIHRDLKPGNILLQNEDARAKTSRTALGDPLSNRKTTTDAIPKISDFGLARPCEGPTGMTTAGVALGTPSYMPPEQARGELDKLGPLIDVYALGAILYELLTGRPPFLGHNDYETVHQVIHQEPISPRAWILDLPRDLETICLKCLQKNPAGRYGSAQELADDLTRFVNGEPVQARPIGVLTRAGRWAKRRPAAAGLIGVSMLSFFLAVGLLGVLSFWLHTSERERSESERLRVAAQAAEDRSEKLREKAEKSAAQTRAALDDMLSEQALSWLATQSELQPQQREFLKRALKYYEEMAAEDGGPEMHYIHGMAHFRVARILDALGRAEESASAYDRAANVLESLANRHPDEGRFANALAKALINRGIMQKTNGRVAESEALLRRGIEVAEAVARQFPNLPEYRLDQGKGLLNLAGMFFDSNRPQPVEEIITKAKDIIQTIVDEVPGNSDAEECLAHCYTVLSKTHQLFGRNAEAQAAAKKATEIYETLTKRHPNVPAFRAMLAGRLNATSHMASDLHRQEDAETAARQAVEIREKLVREFPNSIDHRTELASSLNSLGITLYYRGRMSDAANAYQRALEVHHEIIGQQPPTIKERAGLAALHVNLAMVAERIGRREVAEVNFRRAIQLREENGRDEKAPDQYRIELAQSTSAFASFLSDRQSTLESESYYAKAGELYQKLVPKYPNNLELQLSYGGYLCNFGNLHQQRGDHAAAFELYQKAINQLQPLVDRNPQWKDACVFLANSYLGRSVSHRGFERFQDSHSDHDISEKLDPSVPRKVLVYRHRAATSAAAGDFEKAGQFADELTNLQPVTVDALLTSARIWGMVVAQSNNESHAKKAVDLLRQALSLMKKPDLDVLAHPDFEVLRDRPDFQELRKPKAIID